jgi:hypothetical protein
MEHQNPPWKKLEIVCADIERQLSPNAVVRHNHRVVGKSGGRRKLDISIAQNIGTYPVFIVIDCKKHKRPVSRDKVAAFAEQLSDVKASLGVMISESGFDSGAVAVASEKCIILRSYRQAQQADWDTLVGSQAWTVISHVDVESEQVISSINGNALDTSPDVSLFGFDKVFLGTIHDCWWDIWKGGSVSRRIGNIEIKLTPTEDVFFIHNHILDEFVPVNEITVRVFLTAKKYIVNLAFSGGNVIEDFPTGTHIYHQVESRSIDWRHIIEQQDGIDVPPNEYLRELAAKPSFDLTNAKKYLRVVANKKPESE